jgi:hypothetical protein
MAWMDTWDAKWGICEVESLRLESPFDCVGARRLNPLRL